MNNAPYQQHSDTSRAAAESMKPTAATLRGKVLAALMVAGKTGMTDDEMQMQLGLQGSTQRPRRIELVQSGSVVDSGTTRKTVNGRNATVWISSAFA